MSSEHMNNGEVPKVFTPDRVYLPGEKLDNEHGIDWKEHLERRQLELDLHERKLQLKEDERQYEERVDQIRQEHVYSGKQRLQHWALGSMTLVAEGLSIRFHNVGGEIASLGPAGYAAFEMVPHWAKKRWAISRVKKPKLPPQ